MLASYRDEGGGAALAAHRLLTGLRNRGINAEMLVARKATDDPSIFGPSGLLSQLAAQAKSQVDYRLSKLVSKNAAGPIALARGPSGGPVPKHAGRFDILNLHWVTGGFFRAGDLHRITKPIVWTLHDMWPFTGGCRYDDGCRKFTQQCSDCPKARFGRVLDPTRRAWRSKEVAWRNTRLTIVSPSHWLAGEARSSSLFGGRRIEVIPNGLDLNRFKPLDQRIARSILNLPQDRHLVLFGAVKATSDRRKGFDLLHDALRRLAAQGWGDSADALVLGASRGKQLGLRTHYLGHFHDEISTAIALSAASLAVFPSRQENLSNMIAESLACGVPCVAFEIGGNRDLIEPGRNGELVEPFDTIAMAGVMNRLLSDDERRREFARNARATAERMLCQAKVADQYASLFSELTSIA